MREGERRMFNLTILHFCNVKVALLTLAEAATEYCFVGPQEKEQLRARFEGFRLKNPRWAARN